MEIAAELEYEERGEGEPVLFIHGGFICDSDQPLLSQPALTGFRLIRYHRRGFAGSAPHQDLPTMQDNARDALELLRALGVERVHVVGHSYGGAIAMQLALDAPSAVHSLVLSEPALIMLLPGARTVAGGVRRAEELAGSGDHVAAVDFFMRLAGGPDWRAAADRMIPGASEQADKDAAVFAQEWPALDAWKFDEAAAQRIRQPVLSIAASGSGPRSEVRRLLHAWFPQTEDADIPEANHLLQLHSPQSAERVAEGMAAFLRRHPMA